MNHIPISKMTIFIKNDHFQQKNVIFEFKNFHNKLL